MSETNRTGEANDSKPLFDAKSFWEALSGNTNRETPDPSNRFTAEDLNVLRPLLGKFVRAVVENSMGETPSPSVEVRQTSAGDEASETVMELLSLSHTKFTRAGPDTLDKVKREVADEIERAKRMFRAPPLRKPLPDPSAPRPGWGDMSGITSVWGDGSVFGRNPRALICQAMYYLSNDISIDQTMLYVGKYKADHGMATGVYIRFMSRSGREKFVERLRNLPAHRLWWMDEENRAWDWSYPGEFKCRVMFNGNMLQWEDEVKLPVHANFIRSPREDPCKLLLNFFEIYPLE